MPTSLASVGRRNPSLLRVVEHSCNLHYSLRIDRPQAEPGGRGWVAGRWEWRKQKCITPRDRDARISGAGWSRQEAQPGLTGWIGARPEEAPGEAFPGLALWEKWAGRDEGAGEGKRRTPSSPGGGPGPRPADGLRWGPGFEVARR